MRHKPSRHIRKYKSGKKVVVNPQVRRRKQTYKKWRCLVNMSPSELRRFMDTEEGKEAGLSRKRARELGIRSGRESAEWILKMKQKAGSFEQAQENWTPKMWDWAGRQNSFDSRMRGNSGPLFKNGKRTRKHTALLIWGHDPTKKTDC